MKFVHLADLHLGVRVYEYSMIDDQEYILGEIVKIIEKEQPDAVLVAGDVYDKSVPSVEAMVLWQKFVEKIADMGIKMFVISGNHDNADRLSLFDKLMEKSGVYLCPAYNGETIKRTINDTYGSVNVYMLPFIRPSFVRSFYPDEDLDSYDKAVRCAISHMSVNDSERNILLAHQFVTGAKRSDSEEISIGGLDNVGADAFSCFDYVALGHIHGPQDIVNGRVRYAGTPLKYSFSEAGHLKSVTIVEMGDKGDVRVRTEPLVPWRDMVEIKGNYDEITQKKFYENTSYTTDYLHITLTDEDDVVDVAAKLRLIYKNFMRIDYDNKRTRTSGGVDLKGVENKSPFELFADFYEQCNGTALSENQAVYVNRLINQIWEDEK